ncbi:MAG: hypothetical protein ACRD0J_13555 [Acidimicrobiales bacterium]
MSYDAAEGARWHELVGALCGSAPDWPAGLARACPEGGPDGIRLVRSVAGRLAWLAYLDHAPVPRPAKASDWAGRVSAWCFGERLRYSTAFSHLSGQSETWANRFPDDSLLTALVGMAGCGLGREWGHDLVRRALAGADADDRVSFVCLHALWLALRRDESVASWLLGLSDDMLAKGVDSDVLHYRRARAYRVLGQVEDAFTEVSTAMAMLDAGVDALPVSRDFLGEWGQILAGMAPGDRSAALDRRVRATPARPRRSVWSRARPA